MTSRSIQQFKDLRALVEAGPYSVGSLAQRLGLDKSAISRMLDGKRGVKSAEARRLAVLYRLDVADVVRLAVITRGKAAR